VLVYYHLLKNLTDVYIAYVEDFVFRSHFFKLDEVQRQGFQKLEIEMSEKEQIPIVIENDYDFELPPTFEYITRNVFLYDFEWTHVEEPADKLKVRGCECKKKCSAFSKCCPQLVGETFAYYDENMRTMLALDRNLAIIECNDLCKCDKNCINRFTQQPKNIALCLFKTEGKGWGVKNWNVKNPVIKRGTFILEYTGEMLGNEEARRREVTSYLFDLNMERQSRGFYTIDAFKRGNLARFVNHSCEPNCSMWFINDCTQNPKNQ
jgi:histone-lysine N-methyltransferase SUV39H